MIEANQEYNHMTTHESSSDNKSDSTTLEWTGERMIPGICDERTFWEHVYRYKFAATFARGKVILDIACGEGYGSYALQCAGATHVIGVDVSEDACHHARKKYNLDVRSGDAVDIPVETSTIELAVSFETIEHLEQPELFVKELHRVVKPGSTLIISTPNKNVYSCTGSENKYHKSEMTIDHFTSLLSRYFVISSLWYQCPKYVTAYSLDSLAVTPSPWRNVPGFWRVRNMLLPDYLKDSFRYQPDLAANKELVTQVILNRESFSQRLFNPYSLRKKTRTYSDYFTNSRYIVAVCHKSGHDSLKI